METTDSTFQRDVLESSVPVIVDFYAPWCGPCKILGPIMERIKERTVGKIKVLKLDTDSNPTVAEKYKISSLPTVIFFNGGKVVDEFIGVRPEKTYVDSIVGLLK